MRPGRVAQRVVVVVATATTALALSACGSKNEKTYDISPIFPLSENKCAQYGGDEEGSGFGASCWVTKEQCEKAAADWREAMRGVSGAIQFSC